MAEITQREQQRFDEINSDVSENLMPTIFEKDEALEDEFGGSVIFAVFIECMHALFYMGWTPENLHDEVDTHHGLFLEAEAEENGGAVH